MPTRTKKRSAASRKTKAYEIIARHLGDIPVVDAKQPLRVFVLPQDVARATRKDPGGCVFARACERQFGSQKSIFFRSVAYVQLPDRLGNQRMERFRMPPEMRSLVERFDRGKPVLDVAGFELSPPTPGETFEGKSIRSKRHREQRRLAVINGTTKPVRGRQGQGKYSKPAIVVDLEVRDGRGRVQFKRTAASR